jgi:hypothetical protein
MDLNTIIIIIYVILAILTVYTYSKMQNILVKNNKGSWWYCYWKLQFSYRFFTKFIDESDLDTKQKKKYLLLYRIGLYAKRSLLFFIFLLWLYLFLNCK